MYSGSYRDLYRSEAEDISERYEVVSLRIREIEKTQECEDRYKSFFAGIASKLSLADEILSMEDDGELNRLDAARGKALNDRIYDELKPGAYEKSYANPDVCATEFGASMGRMFSFLYAASFGAIKNAFMGRKLNMTLFYELISEIYTCFCDEDGVDDQTILSVIRSHYHDYEEIFALQYVNAQSDPEYDFFTGIAVNSDLSDTAYLYRYGEYIADSVVTLAEYVNALPEETIASMADTFTEGYRIGFELTGKDLSKKKIAEIRYPIGFERVVRKAVANFEKLGLATVVLRRGIAPSDGYGKSVNRQFDFDHKDDLALYLDNAHVSRALECLENAYASVKDRARTYAGPAVIESFGETPFDPVNKTSAIHFDAALKEKRVRLKSGANEITNRYIHMEERSFTIISFPTPDIGERFGEIFDKTIEINTLDYMKYRNMQSNIIAVLDKADRVHVKGCGANKTDITVNLFKLRDPSKETIFENCVADVNIPVGEVFTSPVLKGTEGVLNVSSVYLEGLLYKDLKLTFKDGFITEYSCANFDNDKDNRTYIEDNILFGHKTLPIGEFAIGTNTTAYRMARDYDIADRLPILIAEKTGPHFAVGDTCYSYGEDTVVYNPDGKEIVARDNEVTAEYRKTDPSKAYFNCHTDITIPYDELEFITAIEADGTTHDIIRDGLFVVEGCEELNVPLGS
ncbi:MAG: aminopeptidase [Lachnospiraceae bacterium]|nr:aminopeptidase [Lachnospiraceae bacterium]